MERWKATFKVANLFLKQPVKLLSHIRNVRYELIPNEDGIIIDIEFDSETAKPPFLQKAMSSTFITRITDIIACVIGDKVETQLLDLKPGDERTQKIFNNMKEPEPLQAKPEPTKISQTELTKIQNMWNKLYTGSILGSIEQVVEHNILSTMSRWYAKAKESVFQTDKYISLWIVFNMIYNYTWKYAYDKPARYEPKKIRHFVEKSGFLSRDECKEIITGDPNLCHKVMPEYEFLGSREEWESAVKNKDVKALEKGHEKYIDRQRKDLGIDACKILRNKYGLEFGKFYLMEDWLHVMSEVLLYIYELRNMVFHEGITPPEYANGILLSDVDQAAFWFSIIRVLDMIDRMAINKIFEYVKPIS